MPLDVDIQAEPRSNLKQFPTYQRECCLDRESKDEMFVSLTGKGFLTPFPDGSAWTRKDTWVGRRFNGQGSRLAQPGAF